jgi:ATP-dependent Lon protease
MVRRKNSRADDDDDSVDSRGNLKGFIAYSDEDEDKEPRSKKTAYNTRSGKKKALSKKMGKMEICEEVTDEDNTPKPPPKISTRKSKMGFRKGSKKRKEESSSSSMETSETEESESEEESESSYEDESEDEDYETEEEYEDETELPMINMIFGGGAGASDSERMVPKRHNMKKEPEGVKKFVDLISKPSDENTIDSQIDMFKGLAEDQQRKVLEVLENRNRNPQVLNPQQSLMFKIMTMNLSAETQGLVLSKFQNLQMLDPTSSEYFKTRGWLEKLTSLPLGNYKDLPVRIEDGDACNAFMDKARKCLNDAIYGQEEAKLQILQFIGAKIANPTKKGTSLLLVGPPGIGKTSLIKNGIAKALGWPFQFISLGGDSDASTYTGHQLVYESSHCGKIVNSLIAAKSMTMVLLFDELDKISATPKGEEVQNLLVHMTDPVQNEDFEDRYLAGIPIDMSTVMYIFSANDINKIDRVLLDRFNVVFLDGYNSKEKLTIAEQFLMPTALEEVGLKDKVGISKEIIQYIIEHYAKEESGVRELKRAMEQIAQKINMLRMFNSKDFPFYIKDFALPFIMKKEHVDLFLKRKNDGRDKPPMGMYI